MVYPNRKNKAGTGQGDHEMRVFGTSPGILLTAWVAILCNISATSEPPMIWVSLTN